MKCISHFSCLVMIASLSASLPANAGILEQILANPRINALLGKPADVLSALSTCKTESYRIANAQLCADAQNAETMLKIPMEMRTVMANPKSAQSLRDLCTVAQGGSNRDTYLCVELLKADSTFALTLAAERARSAAQNVDRNENMK